MDEPLSLTKDIYRVEDGKVVISLHAGQKEAYDATERVILVLAGTQSGKTSFGPIWLYREIQLRGAGDYGVVAPTFPLMETKCIPEFRRFFEETLAVGKYYQNPIKKFIFSKEGLMRTFGRDDKACVVYFGFAENPDSLESATYKAVWCDEAGQKRFKLDSWDALQRRLAINEGRALITTTPYEFNWLKTRIYDNALSEKGGGGGGDPFTRVVRFESTMNPAFPKAEFERQRSILPKWKFDMMFRAIWTKPAGTIYDCFDDQLGVCKPFRIPEDWIRVIGLDFGNVNTAACFFALDPHSDLIYCYRTYHTGSKSATQHVESLLSRESGYPCVYGGSPSEDDWRDKFSAAGLTVNQPCIADVEAGIDAVYQAFKQGRLRIFSNLDKLIRDLQGYSRVLDDNSEPTESIADKNSYHRLDAMRYALVEIMRGGFSGPDVINSFGRRAA